MLVQLVWLVCSGVCFFGGFFWLFINVGRLMSLIYSGWLISGLTRVDFYPCATVHEFAWRGKPPVDNWENHSLPPNQHCSRAIPRTCCRISPAIRWRLLASVTLWQRRTDPRLTDRRPMASNGQSPNVCQGHWAGSIAILRLRALALSSGLFPHQALR